MSTNLGAGGNPVSNTGWGDLVAFTPPPRLPARPIEREVPLPTPAVELAPAREPGVAECPAFDDTAHFALTMADWWRERREASADAVRRADDALREAQERVESDVRREMDGVTLARERIGVAWREGAKVANACGLDAGRLLEARPGACDGLQFESAAEMLASGTTTAVQATQELRVASRALAAWRVAQRESVLAEHERAAARHEEALREARERVAGAHARVERRLRVLWNVVAVLLLLASLAWIANGVVEQERWERELLRGTSSARSRPSMIARAVTTPGVFRAGC